MQDKGIEGLAAPGSGAGVPRALAGNPLANIARAGAGVPTTQTMPFSARDLFAAI
ncbi:MAG: hypothetical protein JNM09_13025 [Blastocatellia bacterium]|nr:hypothetical protein [Blastocatellia bacterium]